MISVNNRFWDKVNKKGIHDCWPWLAFKNRLGFGTIRVGDRMIFAHYFSYELHFGKIPDGCYVRSICHNNNCVNPKHLILSKKKSRTLIPLKVRFWSKVDKKGLDDCWLWLASKDGSGYGSLRNEKGIQIKASRISWELHNGTIPEGLFVCHSCDTPACVNPNHLFLGTSADNSHDMCLKGRHHVCTGENNSHRRLTEKAVMEIRDLRNKKIKAKIIADKFNISTVYVYELAYRKSWKHI